MKSLGILTAAVAALLVAGCRTSKTESDGMMSGKNGSECSVKKEGGCPFTAAAKKDDCCASEAKATDAKKSSCCGDEAKSVKMKDGCFKGKEVSAACAECKKACEASGGCDSSKKCDESKCEEKPKP